MSLNAEEKGRAIALGMGSAKPGSGFEKHFVRAIEGTALPCSAKEKEWVEYFDQWYCDLVDRRIDEVLRDSAEEQSASLDASINELRPVERGHRRRLARRRGERAVRRRGSPVGKQRTSAKSSVSSRRAESRRLK